MVMVKAKFLMFIFSKSRIARSRPHKNQARNGSPTLIARREWNGVAALARRHDETGGSHTPEAELAA
ncbi:hypothetical protein [Rhizobium sp. PL01]|uniref:hypothetical protein n=1 Tax=Rhizobium sp. PL01 TaxID=3085631 RepID=UPI0029825F45|nr:hypothetical protein [Rhizobium sp. PL01]MDW5312743.1 hypothetical protein [Rhizobium sp. PL01]